MPAPSLRFQQLEAAAHFGVTIDQFLACPALRQAEMIAHLMIRSVRQDYAEHQRMTRAERERERGQAKPKGPSFNPMAMQRKAWMLQ